MCVSEWVCKCVCVCVFERCVCVVDSLGGGGAGLVFMQGIVWCT